ncbi:MAG: methyltransferase domain-containing protein [Myxococcota bacterium]
MWLHALLWAWAAAQDPTVSHPFHDAARWADVFDDPARDAWQRPEALVEALRLRPGDTVADVGAGTGYFEPHLARAVGPEGHVLAVDIEPELVDHMRARFADTGLQTVEARLGAADDPALPAHEVDLVLLVDTYHHIGDRVDYFARLKDALAKKGRLVIVDFRADRDGPGPPKAHRIPAEQVVAELAEAGWKLKRDHGDLLPEQYVLELRPR